MRAHERHGHPRIIANLAMSVDGKIDSVFHEGGGFSSRLDRDRLDELRAAGDALVVGAGTIRAEDPPLRVRDPARRRQRQAAGHAEELIVVVVSRSARIPATARFIREPAAARIVAIPEDAPAAGLVELQAPVDAGRLELFRAGHGAVDIAALVAELSRRGSQTIVVEGGGEVVAAFLEADLLDEVRITLCPMLIGGRRAPTPVAGDGWPLGRRRQLRLLEIDRAGDEFFLRYEVEHQAERGAAPDPLAAH